MVLKKEIAKRKSLQILKDKLENEVYTPVSKLKVQAWKTKEPVTYSEKTSGEYLSLKEGDKWGDLFDCAWFNFTGKIPQVAEGKHTVILIDVSGEGLIVDNQGNPLRGITSVTSRDEWPLGMWGKFAYEISPKAKAGEQIDIWMDAGCNDLEGQYKNDGRLKKARIAVCWDEVRNLYYDLAVLLSMYDGLIEEENSAYKDVLKVLSDAYSVLKEINTETVKKARKILSKLLGKKNDKVDFTLSSIGHAHIDIIFLWPLRETIRKGARTYSTVLDLMERYKDEYDYKFGCSQPQMYELIRENYPQLFERIREKINENKWECQGVMWVESDTNIPSGESLIRQIYYGKKYFKEVFDKEVNLLFLPDVFGYSGALPQILKKSGTKYFMTQKLNMNDTNVFPHHTFIWKGIDGSDVLTHMLPESTYNSPAVPQIAMFGKRNFKNKDVSNEALELFGVGDGGGGPGPEHIERLMRIKDMEHVPPVNPEFTQDFFERIEKDKDKYPSWMGELYFERHQGTYTSQADSKFYNRKMEILLHECEFALSLDSILNDSLYPHDKLEKIWHEVLLYQFHDVLPGSSIKRVYEETKARYKILVQEVLDITNQAYANIAANINTGNMINPKVAFNTTSFDRDERIEIDGDAIKTTVPALGFKVFDLAKEKSEQNLPSIDGNILENELLRIEFYEDGSISSIYDKENEKQSLVGKGNELLIHDEEYNNWDIDKTYLDRKPSKLKLLSRKPFTSKIESGFDFEYSFGTSKISQRVKLQNDSRRIDFETKVDWQETYKMLRTSFNVDSNAHEAKCEIQFGYINRATHQNTTWDKAKFEVCAHKYVDIGDDGYGFALLNNCKYGYKIWDNVLDLNLLRSQMSPEVDSDKGHHEFTYSFMPHANGISEGKVIYEGYNLNNPLSILPLEKNNAKSKIQSSLSLVSIEKRNIVAETLKKIENSDEYILRLYEASGTTTKTNISFDLLEAIAYADLVDNKLDIINSDSLQLEFKPFEIKTLVLRKNK